MEPNKERYLNQIRSNTAYPIYRGSTGLITIEQPFTTGSGLGALLFGSIGAAFIVVLARFWKEAAMILVDLGDSTLEVNARGSGGS